MLPDSSNGATPLSNKNKIKSLRKSTGPEGSKKTFDRSTRFKSIVQENTKIADLEFRKANAMKYNNFIRQ